MGIRSADAVPPEAAGWLSLVMQTDGLALVIDLRNLTIVAASDAVGSLVADGRTESLVGAGVHGFLAQPPSGGLGMMARGVLDGYETANALARPDGEPRPVKLWLRAIGEQRPARYALMVLRVDDDVKPEVLPDPASPEAPIVLGVGNRNLTITHITADVEQLCGVDADEVLGTQLLSLFTEDTVPSALWVLAQALQTRTGASGLAAAVGVGGVPVPIDFLVCGSLRPSPEFGFGLIPATDPLLRIPPDQQAMRSVARADRAVALYRRFPEMVIDPALMARLTFRELEIASLLLRGRRTPAIARTLHLSQSTVRNHLSAIFAKAGVHSQQELLDVLGRKAS
jgi:DNA-binding CsgD family transcriptional regulator